MAASYPLSGPWCLGCCLRAPAVGHRRPPRARGRPPPPAARPPSATAARRAASCCFCIAASSRRRLLLLHHLLLASWPSAWDWTWLSRHFDKVEHAESCASLLQVICLPIRHLITCNRANLMIVPSPIA